MTIFYVMQVIWERLLSDGKQRIFLVSSYIITIPGWGVRGPVQAGTQNGILWCHKILSPGEVVNQIIENNKKFLPHPGRKDWSTDPYHI